MTISPTTYSSFLKLGVQPGRYAYAHFEGLYWDYKGVAPDGSLRLYPRTRPPYWRQVNHLQPDGTWAQHKAPGGCHPGVAWLAGAAVLVLLVTVSLKGSANPGPFQWSLGVAALLAGAAFLLLVLPPGVCIDEWDQASFVENPPTQTYEQYLEGERERARGRRIEQGLGAIWAQTADINRSIHPGRDVTPPYSQTPPP